MKKKSKASVIILLAVLFAGLFLLLYPILADCWNKRTQSSAIIDYQGSVNTEDRSAEFAAADEYNAALASLQEPLIDHGRIEGYADILDPADSGMMGYISIEKIDVALPLYHGIDDAILTFACGHVEGTSLPSGGAGTHSVLSAHRGLPSARLFTDLDLLQIGDRFTLTVLDRTLTYEVENISIVAPDDIGLLRIDKDRDLCTLLTCTPYGINTERLLVRGVRTAPDREPSQIVSEAVLIDPVIVAHAIALPIVFILTLLSLLLPVRNIYDKTD